MNSLSRVSLYVILYDDFNPGTMVTTHFQCAMGLNLKSNTIHGSSLLFVCFSALTFFLCHSGFPSPQKKQNIKVFNLIPILAK